MPAAPPAAEDDDAATGPEEERRHPCRAEETGVEEPAPAGRRALRPVLDVRFGVRGDRRRHGPPFLAEATRNCTRERSCEGESFFPKSCGMTPRGKVFSTYAFGS